MQNDLTEETVAIGVKFPRKSGQGAENPRKKSQHVSDQQGAQYLHSRAGLFPPPGPVAPMVLFHLWCSLSVTNFEEYLRLFEPVRDEKAVGEASVRYLYFPDAPRRIEERIPNVRLVAILREPVSRLSSETWLV